MFIEESDHIVSKTYMTRVEGENTRLRHYLARLHRKTEMLLQVSRDVEMFAPFVASLFKVSDSSSTPLVHYHFSNAGSLSSISSFSTISSVSRLGLPVLFFSLNNSSIPPWR